MLEFTRQTDGDQDLVNGTLYCNDGNDTKNRMGRVPRLQKPLPE